MRVVVNGEKIAMHVLPINSYSRFSSNSEASASELQENLEEMFLLILIVDLNYNK